MRRDELARELRRWQAPNAHRKGFSTRKDLGYVERIPPSTRSEGVYPIWLPMC
jgi:hypothetical protein